MEDNKNPFINLFKRFQKKEDIPEISVRPPTSKNYVVGEEKKDYTALVVAGGLGSVLLVSASGGFVDSFKERAGKPVKMFFGKESTKKTLLYGGGAAAVVGTLMMARKLKKRSSNYTDYVVQSGDTLCSICENCGVDVEGVCRINDIDDPNYIRTFDKLRLPADKM